MKSKIKSLFFWAVFFCLLIALMFWGVFFFMNKENLYYCVGKIVEISGYLFMVLYIVFSILTLANKFPAKIKRFEKFKYLVVMLLLLIIEIITVASALPDLD